MSSAATYCFKNSITKDQADFAVHISYTLENLIADTVFITRSSIIDTI